MNKLEMIELLNLEMVDRNARLDKISAECQTRLDDVVAIRERFERGEVRSREEAQALVADIENHLARLKELRQQAKLMTMDLMFDLQAIYQAD